jgi:hypothetical protein
MLDMVMEKMSNPKAMELVNQLEKTFKKAPHLPKGLVDFLGSISPWLALLGGVLGILASLSMLSAAAGLSRFMGSAYMMGYYSSFNLAYFAVAGISELIVSVLLLLAFKPLQAKSQTGWLLMFWIQVINIVSMVIEVVLGGSSIIGLVLGAAIGMYVLFEMKPYFTGKMMEAKKA